jgi:integrase
VLEIVSHDQRVGWIIKGEHGLPVRYRSYVKWFRQIATAAGIPLAVQSRDSRAGGATEADDAGVREEDIRDALTHSNVGTTRRYIRRRSRKIVDVATARKGNRAANDDDGTR